MGVERAVSAANARRDMEIAEARITQTRSRILPRLSAAAGYTRLDETTTVSLGENSMEMGRLDNYSASARATQLLYSGGSASAALRAARFYRDRASIARSRTEERIRRDVKTAFYNALFARAALDVKRESLEHLQRLVEQAEHKHRHDTASEFDLLSAQVRLANERPELIAAQRDLDVALEALRNLIYFEQDEEFEPGGELYFRPLRRTFEELRATGMEKRPEILEQAKTAALYEQGVRAEIGGYWPSVNAWATYQGNNPESSFSMDSGWGWRWSAGLSLEWAVWDGALTRGRVREMALERDKAAATLDDLKRAVSLEIKTYYLDTIRAEEAVAAGRDTVGLAERGLKIADTRYGAGLATYIEYTDTNLALSRARLTQLAALRAHLAALAMLQYACGAREEAWLYGEDTDE